jgi:hypothetical protein
MPGKKPISSQTVEITGLVVPIQWDESGAATGLAISTYDETEYRVVMDDQGVKLLDLVQREVVAAGLLADSETGSPDLTVKAFRATGRPKLAG